MKEEDIHWRDTAVLALKSHLADDFAHFLREVGTAEAIGSDCAQWLGGCPQQQEHGIGIPRRISLAEIAQLAGNTDELVAHVRESTYGDELDEALDELERADSLIGFEHALDAALLEYSEHLSHVFPLSICPVLAYVLAKEREVDNIRAIARGREAGLSEDEIEAELVVL